MEGAGVCVFAASVSSGVAVSGPCAQSFIISVVGVVVCTPKSLTNYARQCVIKSSLRMRFSSLAGMSIKPNNAA